MSSIDPSDYYNILAAQFYNDNSNFRNLPQYEYSSRNARYYSTYRSALSNALQKLSSSLNSYGILNIGNIPVQQLNTAIYAANYVIKPYNSIDVNRDTINEILDADTTEPIRNLETSNTTNTKSTSDNTYAYILIAVAIGAIIYLKFR